MSLGVADASMYFTKRLQYLDVTKHCMIDIAHTIANMVKLLLGTVTNLNAKAGSSSRFSKKHRTFEVEHEGLERRAGCRVLA